MIGHLLVRKDSAFPPRFPFHISCSPALEEDLSTIPAGSISSNPTASLASLGFCGVIGAKAV